MFGYRRRLLGGVLVLLAVAAVTGTAQADPSSNPPRSASPLPAGHTYRVTLLTGEVVTVTTRGGGCPQVTVRPAHHDGVFTKSCGPDGHVRVVPAEAARLLRRTVDPALFDVTELIQQGYDDAGTTELPVIVKHASSRTSSPFTSGLRRPRALTSLGGVAGRMSKRQPLTLSRSTSAAGTQDSLAGVGYIWLDRKVRASEGSDKPAGPASAGPVAPLADDLTQVGAPAAWAAGATGRGVPVAVLDSGIDATHPDLDGKIVASANFSDSPDVVDRLGHGTHVAATIAGSGRASGGVHRGVAPDAQLVVGKVLGDDGFGTDSQVIAGMQWAAPQARVVNMSLGGGFTDGSDPLSQALDALTAQYGTLFVVAAGNDGPLPGTISTPASAASSLAVGAVDGANKLADFSSRGPVTGTHALKPEIVAPGVDIVSARAAGTGLGGVIDAHYTRLSGTSMATPHVAGAAAIVRQRHPDWTADRLKAALTGAATAIHASDLYEQGAGLVTIPPALSTVVSATSVASLGTLRYPQSGTATTEVSWTNIADRPVTLTLNVAVTDRTGKPVPDGAVSLSQTSVVVPPAGSGSVRVDADLARLGEHPGEYEGVVTATIGRVRVRTPVAFYVEPPTYDLTVSATPLPGTANGAGFWNAIVVNLDSPNTFGEFVGEAVGTPVTLRVPAGRYSVMGDVFDVAGPTLRDALAGDAEVGVSGPTTVVLDAAHAHQVTARVTGVDTKAESVGVGAVQAGRIGGPLWWIEPYAFGADAAKWSVWTTAIDGVDVGFLHLHETFGLVSAATGPSPFQYDLIRAMPGRMPADPSYVVGAAEQARLARIDERFHRLDVPGTTTGHTRKGLGPDGFFIAETATANVPATRVDYVTAGFAWSEEPVLEGDSPLARFLLTNGPLDTYAPGSRQSREGFRQPLRVDWYDDPGQPHGCSPDPIRRTRGNLHVGLATLIDQHQRFNCLALFGVPDSTLTLFGNGRQIGSAAGFAADFAIPATAGTYRLVHDQTGAEGLPISTRVTTAWTFRSTGPSDDSAVPVPLFALDYALPLDDANHQDGSTATFTVRQSHGVAVQQITGLTVWTSVDDGATWTAAPIHRASVNRFTAQLPTPSAGQAVSLRVAATGGGGSAIEQTIIRAYRAA